MREAILAPKFDYGSPRIAVSELAADGSLTLMHDHHTDDRGLDTERTKKVIEYVRRVWRRPVQLHSMDSDGHALELSSKS